MKGYLGCLLALAVAGASAMAGASPGAGAQPAAVPSTADGQALYQTYCASCHGVKADGRGPVAEALRHKPADLTQFSLSNGGVFPATRLRRIIDGRDVVAHGTPDMPVWGGAFRSTREGLDENAVQARINAIVAYIESVQLHRGQ